MPKITNEMVQYSYEIAKKVYKNQLTRTQGKEEIMSHTGTGDASAIGHIYAFLSMITGEKYTRTINLYATKYFLDQIGIDYGTSAQKQAARAVLKHVEYYKTVHAYLSTTDKLAHRYL